MASKPSAHLWPHGKHAFSQVDDDTFLEPCDLGQPPGFSAQGSGAFLGLHKDPTVSTTVSSPVYLCRHVQTPD